MTSEEMNYLPEAEGTGKLKAYHSPKMTQLGPIHSIVQSGCATGTDVCTCFSGIAS